MTCRLVGYKQIRKMRRRSVSQACCQSFNSTRLLDIHLATKRDSCLSSVGSDLSLFGMSSQLHFLHCSDDGSDTCHTFSGSCCTLQKMFIPFHHRIESGSIGFHFVRAVFVAAAVVVAVITMSTSATTTTIPTIAIATATTSPRMSVLIRSIG